MHVYPHAGEDGVGFTYTIGLWQTFGHPEIAVFGLARDTSHKILSDCVDTIRVAGRYPLETPVIDVVANGIPVIFKAVRPDRLENCFGTAMRYYSGKSFEAVVLFWPNKQEVFPWDAPSSLQEEGLGIV